MLPFLKPKTVAGVIVSKRKPDGGQETSDETPGLDGGLQAAAQDLIDAVHAKDAERTASAIRAAFEILDAEPHVEGPHLSEEQGE